MDHLSESLKERMEQNELSIDSLFNAIADSDIHSLLRFSLINKELNELIESYLPVCVEKEEHRALLHVCRSSILQYKKKHRQSKLHSTLLLATLMSTLHLSDHKLCFVNSVRRLRETQKDVCIFYKTNPTLELINTSGRKRDNYIFFQYDLREETNVKTSINFLSYKPTYVIYDRSRDQIAHIDKKYPHGKLGKVYYDCKVENFYETPGSNRYVKRCIELYMKDNGGLLYRCSCMDNITHSVSAIKMSESNFSEFLDVLKLVVKQSTTIEFHIFIQLSEDGKTVKRVYSNFTNNGFRTNRLIPLRAKVYQFSPGFPKKVYPEKESEDYSSLIDSLSDAHRLYETLTPWKSFQWKSRKRIYAVMAKAAAERMCRIATQIIEKEDSASCELEKEAKRQKLE